MTLAWFVLTIPSLKVIVTTPIQVVFPRNNVPMTQDNPLLSIVLIRTISSIERFDRKNKAFITNSEMTLHYICIGKYSLAHLQV